MIRPDPCQLTRQLIKWLLVFKTIDTRYYYDYYHCHRHHQRIRQDDNLIVLLFQVQYSMHFII